MKMEIDVTVMEYYYQRRDQRGHLHDYVKCVLVPCYRKDRYETFGYQEAEQPEAYAIEEMEMERIYEDEI